MSSKWHEKKARLATIEFERNLQNAPDDTTKEDLINAQAMGGGDEELFEKKLSKEEKKALAKAKREAKKKAKGGGTTQEDEVEKGPELKAVLENVKTATTAIAGDDGMDHEAADALASAGTICTFSASRKGVDHSARDINIQNFTLQHMGAVLLDETEIVLNHGNRYGLLGRNGAGKSTLLKAIGARAFPIPNSIDLFFLSEEVEPSDTMTALDAVMAVDEERLRLEKNAEDLNQIMANLTEDTMDGGGEDGEGEKSLEERQEEIMEALNIVYERLDALDADTAEVRARLILRGLGFTHSMQSKLTKDFSGGWRMRVSLARALFIQPMCLLLDEPTNHLDMEAVIWLEDYLAKWNRILLLVSHSQDFLNNVCTHTIHVTSRRKLEYYDGNYDQFIKTKSEKEENQKKQYKWEQEQIRSMKEYIARFGHGTSKNAKQAQSKEKVLQKMLRSGLTEKPMEEKPLNFKFTDPSHLPPPVLAFHDVEFGYPGCALLYSGVNLGVDLDSRVALVGPNGAGKTTLIRLMAGELLPSSGDIRPHGHLKLGRFTQHFVDVLDMEQTPLQFFESKYPGDPREEQRKYLGRFGVSGKMQVQKMSELSDGQKSRVVFAKLGRDVPHILLLDEPTNHLDMESIDALAKAVNEFDGGLVLVSHDMRLISQVAREIWICDEKTIKVYKGDIQNFKMEMRAQLGLQGEQKQLQGDFSVKQGDNSKTEKKKEQSKKEVVVPKSEPIEIPKVQAPKPPAPEAPVAAPKPSPPEASVAVPKAPAAASSGSADPAPTVSSSTSAPPSSNPPRGRYIPPHLRKKMQQQQS